MSEFITSANMPVLALRGLAIFPDQSVHFDVGRVKSALALEAAMKKDQTLFLVPQKDILEDDPGLNGLYPIGTVVKVKQILKSHGENIRVLVNGEYRARLTHLSQTEPYLAGNVESISEIAVTESLRSRALRREAAALYNAYAEHMERPAQSVQLRILASSNSGFIADTIAQNSGMDYRDKAKLLAMLHPERRLEAVIRLLQQEVQMLQIESDIQEKTRAYIDQEQRDYYLREQMKAIRDELGDSDDGSEFSEYEKQILLLHLPEETEKKVLKDLERLKKQPFGSSEASVLRNYLTPSWSFPGTRVPRSGSMWRPREKSWKRITMAYRR